MIKFLFSLLLSVGICSGQLTSVAILCEKCEENAKHNDQLLFCYSEWFPRVLKWGDPEYNCVQNCIEGCFTSEGIDFANVFERATTTYLGIRTAEYKMWFSYVVTEAKRKIGDDKDKLEKIEDCVYRRVRTDPNQQSASTEEVNYPKYWYECQKLNNSPVPKFPCDHEWKDD